MIFLTEIAIPLEYNYKRAKLAWYTIDQVFYGLGATPPGISADDLSRAETRQINLENYFQINNWILHRIV